MADASPSDDQVWYAGYGSNLDPSRFGHYLAGGRPPGAARAVPGARDTTPPRATRPVTLTGGIVFGWESPTWGGGIAFLDVTAAEGATLGTAYLLSRSQLADVAAQEMHREPGTDLDLADLLAGGPGGTATLGPGRYETLHVVAELAGRPVLTMTAADPAHLAVNAPSGAYLATMVRGLRGVHGLDDDAVVDYLLGRPTTREGMETWDPAEVRRLVAATRA